MGSLRTEGPLVTIAIPTFNRGGTYLPRALGSACQQLYGNLEILVADNASNDGTAETVRRFRDARIRYHRHVENIGPARNTNFCIDAARGDYTLLLNDDDLIDVTFVAACLDALADGQRPGLIRTGTRIIDESGAIIRNHPNRVGGLDFTDFVIAWTKGLTTPYLCSTMFRTAALKRFGMHSRHYQWDDVITELKIAAAYGRIDIAEVHATFCQHSQELTHAATAEAWCEDSLELLELACHLSHRDPELLRSHLVPFLAKLGYRRAGEMNASVSGRLRAGWIVYRALGIGPEMPGWLKHVFFRESWYQLLIQLKRRWRRFTGRAVYGPGDAR